MQELGFSVVGIDVSPLSIAVSRSRGVKDTRCMSVSDIKSDMGQFDVVVMLNNDFGLLGDLSFARSWLKKLHNLTSKNAVLIAGSENPYCFSIPENRNYYRLNREQRKLPGRWRMRVRFKTYSTPWFDYLYVSKKEMRTILNGTGWAINEFTDSEGPAFAAIICKES
jgi:hypothetical protein